MKRLDGCFCVPHVTRILVIAIVATLLFLGIEIKSPAQSVLLVVPECSNFPPLEKTCPVYDGRVNLNHPSFAEQSSLQETEDESNQELPDHSLDNGPDIQLQVTDTTGGFNWSSAIAQSMLFLAVSHCFRFATESGTRAELKGPFFKDYWASVRSLRGWADGDPFLVNYIGHPMGGSVAGFIQIQNDPNGLKQEIGLSNKNYWHSRMRAMAWAAAYSAQFELGPISEASLGNVGLKPGENSNHPMAWVDLIITPTMGTGWLVGEDLLDRYLIRWFESKISNRKVIIVMRTFLNPTRSFANIYRGSVMWTRENRP